MVSVPTMADALGAASSGRGGNGGTGVPTETCLSCVGTVPHVVMRGNFMQESMLFMSILHGNERVRARRTLTLADIGLFHPVPAWAYAAKLAKLAHDSTVPNIACTCKCSFLAEIPASGFACNWLV